MRILFFWICAVSTDPEQHQLLYGEDHLDAHSPKADKRWADVIRSGRSKNHVYRANGDGPQ